MGTPFLHPSSIGPELGTVEKDGVMYYRVACTGKSTRTNQPKVLLVEFNERSVRVKELGWTDWQYNGIGS